MAYKKYIKKNGKTYGPYLYHSRRVNGKVISEYRGANNPQHYLWAIVLVGIILVGLMVFFFANLNGKFTGFAVSAPQEAKFSLNLNEGELIPAGSKVIIESSEGNYEYSLSEIVSEKIVTGNYYLKNKSISGSGEGYGFVGKKVSYPKVYFTLISKISSEVVETPIAEITEPASTEKTETPSETADAETVQESVNATAPVGEENDTETSAVEETEQSPSETPTEETPSETTEQPESTEEKTETPSETADAETQESSEPSTESQSTETTSSNSEVQSSGETTSATSSESTSSSEPSSDSGASSSESSSAPITGGVISGFFNMVAKFFLSLRLTGNAVEEGASSEISGEVSAEEPFIYELKKGESVNVLEGSVKTNSKQLEDSEIKISSNEEFTEVSTSYSESEEGFGEEYLGEVKQIPLNLEGINLNSISQIKIVYNDEELLIITQGEVLQNETEKIVFNKTELSEDEKAILSESFNGSEIQTTSAQFINGRYVIEYKLGDSKIKYSYDSELNENSLKTQMENDRIKWLKDIAQKISLEETLPEEASQFMGNYSF